MHKNVLESAKYPEAVFVPDQVLGTFALKGESAVKVHGTFTIHGGTHEAVLAVKANAGERKLKATITFSLPYVAWGMKDPSNLFLRVNNTVDLEIVASGEIRVD